MPANLLGQRQSDVRFFLMAVGIRLAPLGKGLPLPQRALGSDHECVTAGIVALIFEQKLDQALEIELNFGNHAAAAGNVSRIDGGEAGIAAEYAEDADTFVRAENSALAIDGFPGARDGG